MASQRDNESVLFSNIPQLSLDQSGNTQSKTPERLPENSTRPGPPGGTNGPLHPPPSPKSQTTYQFLSPDEWARIAHGLGAIAGGEDHSVVRPTSWYFPPKGLPNGLYRDIIMSRFKFWFFYHILSVIRWVLMILQIVLGAILTALGSVDLKAGTPITVLAALQTIIAGGLALLHNSGLPDRFRSNQEEFAQVESHIRYRATVLSFKHLRDADMDRELLDTGIVPDGYSIDAIIADCWAKFQAAQSTVQANVPANYIPSCNLIRPQTAMVPIKSANR